MYFCKVSVWEGVFWGSAVLVLYPYVIYPALVIVTARIKYAISPPRLQDPPEWPAITILIPAYKESRSVVPKMESIRHLDYPKEKLQILWVVATYEGDESFAPTMEALQAYPEVKVLVVPHRGKIYSLNEALMHTDTSYVLLTDADVLLAEDSLKLLVRWAYSSNDVGLVGGGRYMLPAGYEKAVGAGEASYLTYEKQISAAESAWGLALGVWGGILLIKKALWSPMPSGVVDDLYLNLDIILKGKRCVVEPHAKGYELPSITVPVEFQRKSRIAYTAFHTLAKRLSWREWFKVPLFSFFLISHKVFRYLIAPVALISLTVSSLPALLQTNMPFYGIVSLFLLSAWIEAYLMSRFPNLKIPSPFSLPGYFLLVHVAQLAGFWKFLRGEDPLKVWQRLPRTELQPSQP